MEEGTAVEAQQETEKKKEWYEGTSLEEAKAIIKANITTAARSFIAIGYYLKHIRDRRLYLEDGHASIWEFAYAEYGISKSTASRYMAMNDRFSKGGDSPIIAEPFREFGKSQLQEMLALNGEQLEQVTPDMRVMDIRELTGPEPEMPQEIQIPGQMDITQFPEYLPETFLEMEDAVPARIGPQILSVEDMINACGLEVQKEFIAIPQQECAGDPEERDTIEGEFKEIENSAEPVVQSELPQFEIEYAQFTRITVEAENEEDARDIAAVMDGEDIAEYDPHEYHIWNITQVN